MGTVHEMVDIGFIEEAFVFEESDGGVPASGVLVFSDGLGPIEPSDEIDDDFPLFVDMFWVFSDPLEHGFHEHIFFDDDSSILYLFPYFFYSSFNNFRN